MFHNFALFSLSSSFSSDQRLICGVTGPRRFPPPNHATGFEIFFRDEKAVKSQYLPTTAAELGRIQTDEANWYLETVQNHTCQSAKRLDSSRDRRAPGPARWPRRNSERPTTSDSPSVG